MRGSFTSLNIVVPKDLDFTVRDDYSGMCTPHTLPEGVFENKEYPTCKCGRKYVPINKGDTECFLCLFTQKPSAKIIKQCTPKVVQPKRIMIKCSKCGLGYWRLRKSRAKTNICLSCHYKMRNEETN